MQYLYVICYDTETKEVFVDVETAIAKFNDCPVFDPDLGMYQGSFSDSEAKEYLAFEEKLALSLKELS